ncbi:molybdopterin-dependent oxidoreductase [Enteroscipio rubneri]|uniref:Dehydrogenase n=1 Tax=Enteroscipio rubneri TaxID=2070686 RepID=A0A2K2UEM3_9ACTN|nr:molybdopterin-dependent oxidoreductase [Enteroscipio rubneri]PNV68668.1 dehydrogenase [Enteroscipio rubneri]
MDAAKVVPATTRRTFLKGGAALAAALAIGAHVAPGKAEALTESEGGGKEGGTWVTSFCGTCIWTNCGLEVKVIDGVAVEVRGNKDHPSNKGTMCPRGAAQLMNLYNPYRFKAPVKRTNPEKGLDVDPGWQEISWDEAKGIIFEKMAAVRDTDPRRLMFMYGFGDTLHEGPFTKLFTGIFGTPNYAMSAGPLCEVHHAPQLFNNTFVDRIDVGYCNYLITLGRNMGAQAAFASGPARAMADAWKRGMKTVVVDPHSNVEASHGEWLPITPGGDMAFVMSMANVLLHELDVYDAVYLRDRTNAPYLIQDDLDYARDAGTGKPLVWDVSAGGAKTYDDETLGELALTGSYTVNGQPVEPAFEKIKASVKDATPEWAAEKTGIAAETIRRITAEFAEEARIGSIIVIDGVELPYRPVCIATGRGAANTMQGMRTYYVADLVNALVGAIGVPGSVIHADGPKFVVEDGVIHDVLMAETFLPAYDAGFSIPFKDLTGKQFSALAKFPILTTTMGAIVDPQKYFVDYDIDVMFPIGANPFMADSSRDLCVAAFQKVPFTWTVGYNMDETSMFCDVVLPEHSSLERQQIRPVDETMTVGRDTIALAGVNYKESPVEHVYDTCQYEDIIMEMAYYLGYGPKLNAMTSGFFKLVGTEFALDPAKEYTYAEIIENYLQSIAGNGKGIDWFREHGFYTYKVPIEECYDYVAQSVGRVPVYNWRDFMVGRHLKANCEKWGVEQPGWEGRMGEVYAEYTPLPEWHDNFLTDPSDEFDLFAVNWKISPRILGLGGQDENPWLREVVENLEFDDLRIQINPAAAEERGLRDGDRVIVESQHGGSTEGVLKVTGLMQRNSLGFPAQGGHVAPFMNPTARRGTTYNQLLSADDGKYFPESGSISIAARVKIRKAE